MNKKALEQTLRDIGLSENEASVYLAALSLGSTTISRIANAANIKRTTTYSVIESLKMKGLIRTDIKGIKKFFKAESPEKLESIFEEKRKKFQASFPDLLALHNITDQSQSITYYEGIEGMRNGFLSLLDDVQPHDEYLVIGNVENNYSIDQPFFESFFEKRAKLSRKRNFTIKVLLEDTPAAREFKKYDKNFNRHTKLFTSSGLPTNFVVIPKKALIHQAKLPVTTVLIENQNIIKTLQSLFDIIWNSVED